MLSYLDGLSYWHYNCNVWHSMTLSVELLTVECPQVHQNDLLAWVLHGAIASLPVLSELIERPVFPNLIRVLLFTVVLFAVCSEADVECDE
jgi:hypothetical protein